MRPRLLLTINWKFAVDFFARGLHTRTAVARLPLRQLGFLVYNAVDNVGMPTCESIGLLSLNICRCLFNIQYKLDFISTTVVSNCIRESYRSPPTSSLSIAKKAFIDFTVSDGPARLNLNTGPTVR